MPLKRTPIPSILQSSSRYKAKPLSDVPLVPVLLRLAQQTNICFSRVWLRILSVTKFTRNYIAQLFVQVSVKTNVSRAFHQATALRKKEEVALKTFVFSELFGVHFNKYFIFIKDIKPYPERGYKFRTYHLFCVVFRRPCCTNLGP